jgi:hypothetical protein
MATRLTERDLERCGLIVDPQNPGQVVPLAEDTTPDDSWDEDRLGRYAAAGLGRHHQLLEESVQLGRKSTVQLHRAGRALSLAHKKLKAERRWCTWLRTHGISTTSAWEAMELYRRERSEKEIEGLTPTQAKTKYGITRPPRSKQPREPVPDSASPGQAAGTVAPAREPQVLSFPGAMSGDAEPASEERHVHDQRHDEGPECSDGGGESATSSAADEDHLGVLAKVVDRLGYIAEDIRNVDLKEEQQADYCALVERGIQILQQIRKRMTG